jgi:hypothetical protein
MKVRELDTKNKGVQQIEPTTPRRTVSNDFPMWRIIMIIILVEITKERKKRKDKSKERNSLGRTGLNLR